MATDHGTTSEVPGYFITLIEAVIRNIPRDIPKDIALRRASEGELLAQGLDKLLYPEGQPAELVSKGRLREKIENEIMRFDHAGKERLAILVLIELLQLHLASDHDGKLPYSNDLEWLMRAIASLYQESETPDPGYVANKLWNGVSRLVRSLKEQLPGFSEQWSKYSL